MVSPLRLARIRRGFNLESVAALAGIGIPHLARVEKGQTRASTPVALRLAEIFPEVTRDQILFPEFYVEGGLPVRKPVQAEERVSA